MAKYVALIYDPVGLDPHGTPEVMEAHGPFIGRAYEAKVLAGGEPLADTDGATTVPVTGAEGGEVQVADGPAGASPRRPAASSPGRRSVIG